MNQPTPIKKVSFTDWLRNCFLAGLFSVVPMALVFWLVQLLYNIINGPADVLIRASISNQWLPGSQYFIDHSNGTIPGAGFMITIFLILIVGIGVSNYAGKEIMKSVDRLFTSVPLVKTIYQSVQQLLIAFQQFSARSGAQKFNQVVFIQMAGAETYCLGFLTGQTTDPNGLVYGNVFVPTPPSPFNGMLFLVPLNRIIPANFISVEQATKMIITMGLVSPTLSEQKTAPMQPSGPD